MSAPHEDDLRTALHEAEVGVDLLRRSIELAAHGQENGPEVTAARDRLIGALVPLFDSETTNALVEAIDTLIANDINCGCPAGDRYRAVPVAAPVPEVTR